MTDLNQLVEVQQSLTFLGTIGGLPALVLRRVPASPARPAPAFCARTPPSSVRS